jgi:hypothetical protein
MLLGAIRWNSWLSMGAIDGSNDVFPIPDGLTNLYISHLWGYQGIVNDKWVPHSKNGALMVLAT